MTVVITVVFITCTHYKLALVHTVQTGIQTGNLLNLMSYYTQVTEQINTNFPYPSN
jgi:hypothetical protein